MSATVAEGSKGSGRSGPHCLRHGYTILFVENEVPGLFYLSPHSQPLFGGDGEGDSWVKSIAPGD